LPGFVGGAGVAERIARTAIAPVSLAFGQPVPEHAAVD